MPLVVITHHPSGSIPWDAIQVLTSALPGIVAQALHIPEDEDGHLTPSDVRVHWQEAHAHDVNALPVSIEVLANDYPARRENIQFRTEQIMKALKKLSKIPRWVFGEGKLSVWVRLSPGGYVRS